MLDALIAAIESSAAVADGPAQIEERLARIEPGCGMGVQFKEVNRAGRKRMLKILEYVQKTSAFYDNRYFTALLKR